MKIFRTFLVRTLAVVGAAKVGKTMYGMIMPYIKEYRATLAEANGKKQ